MVAEIVSNGMLSLPSSLAVVGLVPGVVIIVFLGAFGLFTAWILIQFKLRHPEGMVPCLPEICYGLLINLEKFTIWVMLGSFSPVL